MQLGIEFAVVRLDEIKCDRIAGAKIFRIKRFEVRAMIRSDAFMTKRAQLFVRVLVL